MSQSTKDAWAVVTGIAMWFGIVGLYLAFGRAGALVIPLATLCAVLYFTVRDLVRKMRG